MKASASWLTWLSGGKILFGEEVDGESGVATVDVASGNIERSPTYRESSTPVDGAPRFLFLPTARRRP